MTNPVSSQGLVERLRSLYIMDEVGSDNPLGRDAADALEAQSDRIASLEAALTGIANAVHLGPSDSVSTWHSLAAAMRKTANAALNPPPSGDS